MEVCPSSSENLYFRVERFIQIYDSAKRPDQNTISVIFLVTEN
jgi:hypothetical protein